MNATISKLALQALLGRRRFWLLVAFPAAMVGLTALVVLMSGEDDPGWMLVGQLGFTIVLPLVAILAASSVLGPEVDDGSVVYLLAKPVNRYGVAFSKWVVAWLATLVVGAGSLLLAGLVAGGGEQALGWFVASLVAGTTYSAFFLALSAFTRHAVVVGLVFVLIWEGLLGGLLSGVAWLSIGQWGIKVGDAIASELGGRTNLPWALAASLVLTVAAVWFAGDRLRSFALTGDE